MAHRHQIREKLQQKRGDHDASGRNKENDPGPMQTRRGTLLRPADYSSKPGNPQGCSLEGGGGSITPALPPIHGPPVAPVTTDARSVANLAGQKHSYEDLLKVCACL
jgi:hypothetical protein